MTRNKPVFISMLEILVYGMRHEVVILAAGLGTRMEDRTENKPKCLVNVDGKSILKHQVEILTDLDIKREDIYLVIGSSGKCWTQESYNRIRELHENIVVNFDNTTKKQAFSLQLGIEKTTNDSVIVLDGDVFVEHNIIKSLLEYGSHSAIISKTAESSGEPGSKVVSNNAGVVKNIGKEIQPESYPWHIHAGISKIEGRELNVLKQVLQSESLGDLDVGDILRQVSQKESIFNIVYDDGWINMNRPEDIKKASKLLQ